MMIMIIMIMKICFILFYHGHYWLLLVSLLSYMIDVWKYSIYRTENVMRAEAWNYVQQSKVTGDRRMEQKGPMSTPVGWAPLLLRQLGHVDRSILSLSTISFRKKKGSAPRCSKLLVGPMDCLEVYAVPQATNLTSKLKSSDSHFQLPATDSQRTFGCARFVGKKTAKNTWSWMTLSQYDLAAKWACFVVGGEASCFKKSNTLKSNWNTWGRGRIEKLKPVRVIRGSMLVNELQKVDDSIQHEDFSILNAFLKPFFLRKCCCNSSNDGLCSWIAENLWMIFSPILSLRRTSPGSKDPKAPWNKQNNQHLGPWGFPEMGVPLNHPL